MPDDIRLLLAGSDFAEPLQLAERADGQWLAKQQDGGYNWVSTSSHQQPRRDVQPSAAIAAPQPPAGDHGTCTGLCYSGFMRVLSGCCAPALCRFFWMSERSFQSLTSSPPIWISIAVAQPRRRGHPPVVPVAPVVPVSPASITFAGSVPPVPPVPPAVPLVSTRSGHLIPSPARFFTSGSGEGPVAAPSGGLRQCEPSLLAGAIT
ncbi:uncharacterized protein LOC129707104 [Leucoraja erinacea]|uniref:uncharacterized protein LOC129707104 n=1 Tax=Leucoraja erinaceus TaxID=7782 RepID=UPI0024569D19|nr:uncharacterized protein LOC129707104 [Leucoraja erinacea]